MGAFSKETTDERKVEGTGREIGERMQGPQTRRLETRGCRPEASTATHPAEHNSYSRGSFSNNR